MPTKLSGVDYLSKPYVRAFLNLFLYKKGDTKEDIPYIAIIKLV